MKNPRGFPSKANRISYGRIFQEENPVTDFDQRNPGHLRSRGNPRGFPEGIQLLGPVNWPSYERNDLFKEE